MLSLPGCRMVWKGTACPLSQGWQERFLSKTFAAGASQTIWIEPLRIVHICPNILDWYNCLIYIESCAAGIGSVAGAVLAMLERKPVIPHMAGTAASAAICLSVYGGTSLATLSHLSWISVLLQSGGGVLDFRSSHLSADNAPRASADNFPGADAVLLEGVRILRCHDSPVNSVVAAGAASYILVSSHSAHPLALCLLCTQSLHVLYIS